MITRSEDSAARREAAEMIRRAGLVLTDEEVREIEVADFGLSNLRIEGAQIATLFQTERIAAKVIAIFPGQTLPEHRHPPFGDDPGKEETVRVAWGRLLLFNPGEDTLDGGRIPRGKADCYTMRNELVMLPGSQSTLAPGTKHWFQAGAEGVVFFSLSTCVRDAVDQFTDPRIVRQTKILD